MGVELRVLGPLEIATAEGCVALPGNKHRRLLAALTIPVGRVVSVDALVDAVWGESPPASARKLLQVYVSQLRKVLPRGITLSTASGGYVLDLDGADLDSGRLERLAAETADALDENPTLAVSLAERALALWRGPAYADVMYDDFARSEAERLEELRARVAEDRLDALLRVGRHETAVPEALALADEHPLRERLQELAMLALYRAGRQAEALDRYDALRRRLDDELGLEPGLALKTLQRRMLQQDPTLELSTVAFSATALPVPPNPLVGRERELEELEALLAQEGVRLVVLTGAGGSGKTRLALEAAHRVAPRFANGAVVVELAPLRDPALVLPTIAQRLGLADVPEDDQLQVLAAELRGQELLLLLDNAEHLRGATPAFVELLARAPRLTMLVTSRAVLHLSGEHVFPVGPLPEDAALELFAQRARAHNAGFVTRSDTEATSREICRRVDCLPLAIELAAARIRTLTPAAVLERLTQHLGFLAGGPRDLPARQQTLRETLDWSYGLLTSEERAFLARLSVFAGGATLAAAAAVCADRDDSRALDLLAALVDASLVVAEEREGEMRYRLLETVRQYAARRLDDLDADDTRRRHADWCLALADEAERELTGDRQAHWFATLEREHDNARAALDHLTATGQRALVLRLTVGLSRFWYVRGHLREASVRLEHALSGADDSDPGLARRAWTAAAAIALLQGDYEAATRFSEGALETARETGEERLVANALSNLGAIVHAAGDHDRAAAALEEAVRLARQVGDTRVAALAINNLGDLALTRGEYDRARPLFEESHELLHTRGDTANIARSLFNLGAVDLMLDELEPAEARFREGLRLASETGDMEDVAWCLEGLAALAARASQGERAATLLGAASALLERMGADFKPFERQLHGATEARARALCGVDEWTAAMECGESLPLTAALELAIESDGLQASPV